MTKKMNMKTIKSHIFLYLYICILAPFCAFGQEKISLQKSMIELTTKHYGDHVVLRWAPVDEQWWWYGNKNGYQIARRDLSNPDSKYQIIVDSIFPWSEDQIEKWYVDHPEDEILVLPLQTIHKEWENTKYDNDYLQDIFEKNTYFKQRHQMTLLASDLYPVVADAAGLRYVDNDIESGKMYGYRVRINRGNHEAYSIARRRTIIDKPIIFEVVEKEGAISIKWQRKLHSRYYTAYWIERSIDGKSYTRLNQQPFVHAFSQDYSNQKYIIYTDKVENYIPYYYRIIGIDAFGDESLPSDPIKARAKDRTPPVVKPPIVDKSEDGNSNIIKWSHEPMNEIAQVVLYKKDYDKSPKIVYAATKNDGWTYQIEDNHVIDGMSDYYLVMVDTAANRAQSTRASMYKKDETPPKAPEGLKADVDTTGSVILTWDQPKDNDVIGYYIFTADRKHDNFIKLNQKRHPLRLYEDTINMTLLTEKRFYKVAAIDKGGNIGAYSDIIEVTLPDKIPPAPSLFYNYKVDSSGIFLGLMPSSSRDVVTHNLYRRKSNGPWILLESFEGMPPQVYLDKKVESNTYYDYRWIAVDEAGLKSSAKPSTVHLKSMDMRSYYAPQIRLAEVQEGIKVECSKDIPGKNYRIQIIRSINKGKYRTVKTLPEGTYQYIDKTSKSNSKRDIKYRAKILYKDGHRSKFGKIASINW